MKIKILLILFAFVLQVQAQKYYTKSGITDFKASVDAFEAVEAINKSTTVIFNTESGEIASLLFINAFQFDIALMQEHFNENYMDSNKFPKATFKGKIHDFDVLSETFKSYKLKGVLNIKGVEKMIETEALLCKQDDKIILKGEFFVKPQDFNIKIPNIIRKKIAETITIKMNYELVKK